jgi:hypothetical protein
MGFMVRGQKSLQSAFGATPGAFKTLVRLYDINDVNERFLTSLSESVSSLATGHYDNQVRFVDAGVLERLVSLASQRADPGVMLAAVNAFRDLVNGTVIILINVKDALLLDGENRRRLAARELRTAFYNVLQN